MCVQVPVGTRDGHWIPSGRSCRELGSQSQSSGRAASVLTTEPPPASEEQFLKLSLAISQNNMATVCSPSTL